MLLSIWRRRAACRPTRFATFWNTIEPHGWRRGQPRAVEYYLQLLEDAGPEVAFLIYGGCLRLGRGETPNADEYAVRFPHTERFRGQLTSEGHCDRPDQPPGSDGCTGSGEQPGLSRPPQNGWPRLRLSIERVGGGIGIGIRRDEPGQKVASGARAALRRAQRAHFRRSEIVARPQHPNIIQSFRSAGRPGGFYLELVDGTNSLSAAARSQRHTRGAGRSAHVPSRYAHAGRRAPG